MLPKVLWGFGILVVLAVTVAAVWIGPRNILGMLRYDQREDGHLRVGELAPELRLHALDGESVVPLHAGKRARPLVLIFGSFT